MLLEATPLVSLTSQLDAGQVVLNIPQDLDDDIVEDTQHPLELVFEKCPVNVARGNGDKVASIDKSIQSLDRLIHELSQMKSKEAENGSSSSSSTLAYSPGFLTTKHAAPWVHHPHRFQGRYETLAQSITIPLPHPSVALVGFQEIKKTWLERRQWAASVESDPLSKACSCIEGWEHLREKRDVLFEAANQSLEQLMVHEADLCLRSQFATREDVKQWDELYSPPTCLSPYQMSHSYLPDISIRLIPNRREYAKTYVMAALASHFTIDVNICYLFPRDPLHRYILLDLLPYVATQRNVTVRIIADTMVMESALLKAPLHVENSVRESTEVQPPGSFFDYLPAGSPAFERARQPFPSSLPFLREIIKISQEIPNNRFQLRWWCARDKKMKYPIKNHIKCHVFDGQEVICGGSNVAPLIGSSDCDMHMSGALSAKYHVLFNDMWEASSGDALLVTPEIPKSLDVEVHDPEPILVGDMVTLRTEVSSLSSDSFGSFHSDSSSGSIWTDEVCFATLVQSCPSSDGEDAILRHVLGAIGTAKESIVLCMGHSNIPFSVSLALAEAIKRGVTVRILMNSWYSCDLRGGQRDLFLSLRDLITVAPKVEVWVTALPSQRERRSRSRDEPLEGCQPTDEKVPFLHSKYVVIDRSWSSIGSWNMWTRSAFYEMEANIMVHSEAFASSLIDKFEEERSKYALLLSGVDDTNFFCPKGCSICHQFGSFYSSDS